MFCAELQDQEQSCVAAIPRMAHQLCSEALAVHWRSSAIYCCAHVLDDMLDDSCNAVLSVGSQVGILSPLFELQA